MTEKQLAEIKERAAKATEGPWNVETLMWDGDYAVIGKRGFRLAVLAQGEKGDADFIAHARQDIPELIAEVERLRKTLVDIYEYTSDLTIIQTINRRHYDIPLEAE